MSELDDLSQAQRDVAEQLSQLAADPGDSARMRIMAAVRRAPGRLTVGQRRVLWARGWRLALVATAAFAAIVGGASGAMAASSESLPSSPAYTLRLAGENVRLLVTLDRAAKIKLQAAFVADRLRQAREAVSRVSPQVAKELLRDAHAYLADAQRATAELSADERSQAEPTVGDLTVQELNVESDAAEEERTGVAPSPVRPGESPRPQLSPEPTQTDSPNSTDGASAT
jgi:hypothetical protein